jgi:glycosyltransferase involved in cell wall biosynthesis
MKIVVLAPPDFGVPPAKYGGTELVIYNQVEEFVRMGHEVYLLGPGVSKTSAHLISIFPDALIDWLGVEKYNNVQARNYYKIYGAAIMLSKIQKIKPDIIYNHCDWRFLFLSQSVSCPIINTMHIIKKRFEDLETFKNFKNSNYVSISNNQRNDFPELNWVKTIYNGIDVTKFDFNDKKDNYFVYLGRTTPDKGLAEICKVIKNTKYKLKIGAKLDTDNPTYFDNEVKPLIDGDQIQFLGEVDHIGKNALLKNAKALLIWLNWEEPFGMVFPEAYACGTPVIGNKRGSLPEIVEEGKTGFLVNNLEEMAKKLAEVEQLDSQYCREYVEKRFSKEIMAQQYIDLAENILGSHAFI